MSRFELARSRLLRCMQLQRESVILLFFIAFHPDPTLPEAAMHWRKSITGETLDREQILLTHAAVVHMRFRFARTVTILQQTRVASRGRWWHLEHTRGERIGQTESIVPACRGLCLPNAWASAGAFSLLTRRSKLAQY